MVTKEQKDKRYWYFITITECPVCGKGYEERERKYNRKPKKYENRHSFEILYDYCDVL